MTKPRKPAAPPDSGAPRSQRATITVRLIEAEVLCKTRGTLLTPLRREVLKLLLERGGSATAGDLHHDMRNTHGRVAPMTVYRALDFLIQMQLVRRVDSLNVFVAEGHGEAA